MLKSLINNLLVLLLVGVNLPANAGSIVIDGVNVLPMDREVVLTDQRVVVDNGLIRALGPVADIPLPVDAEVIDAAGQFLIPGLSDMHVHLSLNGDDASLLPYLAHGVTTVRNLNGVRQHFIWRDQVQAGALLGPTIYTSGNTIVGLPPEFSWVRVVHRAGLGFGPLLLGIVAWLMVAILRRLLHRDKPSRLKKNTLLVSSAGLLLSGGLLAWSVPLTASVQLFVAPFAAVPESEAEARQMVQGQKTADADFIKPYNYLPRPLYFAVADEAQKQNLYVAGHTTSTPEVVEISEWIRAGQDEVVHADELTHYFWVDYDPAETAWVEYDIDMNRVDAVATQLAKADIVLTPTLITNEISLLGIEDAKSLLAQPEYAELPPAVIDQWRTVGRFVKWRGQEAYRRQKWRPLLMELTRSMQEQGGLLNVGTDVSVEGIVPGYAVHQELALLVEAGLTPYEALSAATRNPGETVRRMGGKGNFGTIAAGQRADLVLLEMNPFENILHTRQRAGVMVRGKWFSQADLSKLVGNVRAGGSGVSN